MPSQQRRQRQLARAKWQRQQTRRIQAATRRRKMGVGFGVLAGLVATAALVWLVVDLVRAEDSRDPQPTLPSYTGERPSFLPEPTATQTKSGRR